jgi:hypothetical protein
MLSRILAFLPVFLCAAALCTLLFLAGAASQYYQWSGLKPLEDALEGGKAWVEGQPDKEELLDRIGLPEHVSEALEQRQVHWDKTRAYTSYTLINMRYVNSVFLLDMNGNIVHSWRMPFAKAWQNGAPHIRPPAEHAAANIRRAQLFPNGDLLVVFEALRDSPYGYGLVKMDKDSNVIWTYNDNAHHDFYIDEENGNIYALTQHWLPERIPGLEALPFPLMTDYIVTLSANGEKLKEISLLEAFKDTPFELMLFQKKKEFFPRWDLIHSNAISKLEPSIADKFLLFKPGYLLVSSRGTNTVAVIDPEIGKVVWAENGIWEGQHSSTFMPNGHIAVFDNYGQVDNSNPKSPDRIFSRIIELDPVTHGVAWHYTGTAQNPFESYVFGRVQPLPNDHFFVTETLSSRLFEVTREGDIVWEYVIPQHFKKKRDFVDLRMLDLLTAITSAVKYPPEYVTFLQSPVSSRKEENNAH